MTSLPAQSVQMHPHLARLVLAAHHRDDAAILPILDDAAEAGVKPIDMLLSAASYIAASYEADPTTAPTWASEVRDGLLAHAGV